jgi:ABC-type antimicrobial peptide transport system permease subunit
VRSLGETPRDVVYLPYTQSLSLPGFSFVVRTATDPAQLSLALAAAGRQIDPDLRVMQSMTMAQHLGMSRLLAQMGAFMLTAFAVLALALATVGVYGLMRYTVARRTREVGIRMALGADAAGVARLLATNGVRLVLIGGAIGIAASLLAARFLSTLLFGVGRFDPVALIGAPVVLVVAAWLAAFLPAWRASRADPLASLRID